MSTMEQVQNPGSLNEDVASIMQRLKAFAFDYLLICVYLILLFGATAGFIQGMNLIGSPLSWPENPILADALAFAILVLPVALYFALSESSVRQATWGKRRLGIRVVGADGGRISLKQAFVRSLLKLLPWQIAHTCLFHVEGWPVSPAAPTPLVSAGFILVWILVGGYILSALLSRANRTPYDRAVGSYVIDI